MVVSDLNTESKRGREGERESGDNVNSSAPNTVS